MTAEVVIMNKKGMALAADSAITSGADGFQKVYYSANKLFSLSEKHPVGFMVYGSASFMEVPWEIIIKMFRRKLADHLFDDLADYGAAFLEFLKEDARFNQREVEPVMVDRTFSDHLIRIVKEVEEKAEEQQPGEADQEKMMDWLNHAVEAELEFYKQQKNILLDLDYHAFVKRFMPLISEIASERIMYPLEKSFKQKLVKLAYEAMQKDYFSRGSSGLVICGYGESEIFPHFINYRLEGFVFQQLKYKKLKEKRIGYSPNMYNGTASITAFAQKEMVESFMRGIEPEMKDAIKKIIGDVLHGYGKQIEKHTTVSLTDKQLAELQHLGREMSESIGEAVQEYQQKFYLDPLLDVVRALPTEELADMAESLINLTSFKRRVTRAAESVGLPVDVAVITKGDGFVWIKRKEYIDRKINFYR